MRYGLENKNEAIRLENQSKLPKYDLSRQLDTLTLNSGDLVLDAGCGSGLLGRYLYQQYGKSIIVEACDLSEVRIEQAKQLNESYPIRFFQSSLENIVSPEEKYNKVISRYVFQHLHDPYKVSSEIFRVLKPGGKIFLIEADGVLFNLHSDNKILNNYLARLKQQFKFDLHIGRKLPKILSNSGFSDISWKVEAVSFQGKDLEEEYKMYKERLNFAMPVLESILGNDTQNFINLYLQEFKVPENIHFINQFIVTGQKA